MTAAEIVSISKITRVAEALGGKVRGKRCAAFWRGGDNTGAVSLNDDKGAWFDHVSGEGGGVLDLIQVAIDCDRKRALVWLAEFQGVSLDDTPTTPVEKREFLEAKRIRQDAVHFAAAATLMAELALEELPPTSLERAQHTALLVALRVSPEAPYREWLERDPEWAAALVHAGRESEERLQRLLSKWVAAGKPEVAQG